MERILCRAPPAQPNDDRCIVGALTIRCDQLLTFEPTWLPKRFALKFTIDELVGIFFVVRFLGGCCFYPPRHIKHDLYHKKQGQRLENAVRSVYV